MRTLLREIFICYGCLLVTPTAGVVFFGRGNSLAARMESIASSLAFFVSFAGAESLLILALVLLAPYVVVQAVRAYRWGRRSETGRKWASLYFCILSVLAAAWYFVQAWDLFYFMYALGDIPGELRQFFAYEGGAVVIMVGTSFLAARCLSVFLNPTKRSIPPEPPAIDRLE